jgi:RNA polymerase sigma-70 factor (ECF subfamily)
LLQNDLLEPMSEEAFQTEFVNFRRELMSFIYRLVANKQDAEDLVQDSFIKAMTNLSSYQPERASVKTWVFTIAINSAKNHLSKMKRWGENDLTICENYHSNSPEKMEEIGRVFHSSPDARFEMKEHLDYCFTCISKTLELTQQICLLLKEVYGFKQDEIMKITGLSEGKVKHGIADARKNMIRIFKNRCALINKNGICNQCTALNGIFNPEQDAHIKAQELKLSPNGNQEKLLDLRMQLVRETDPLNGASELHTFFLENIPSWVEEATS